MSPVNFRSQIRDRCRPLHRSSLAAKEDQFAVSDPWESRKRYAVNRDISCAQAFGHTNFGRTCEQMSSNSLGCQSPARSVRAATEAVPCSRQIVVSRSPRPKFRCFRAVAVPGPRGPLVDTPLARCQKAHEGNCVQMSQASRLCRQAGASDAESVQYCRRGNLLAPIALHSHPESGNTMVLELLRPFRADPRPGQVPSGSYARTHSLRIQQQSVPLA